MTKTSESFSMWHECQCPKCGRDDQLDVAATLWVRLTEDGSDADESRDGSHEWDDNSAMICAACNHSGTVADFREEPVVPPRDHSSVSQYDGEGTLDGLLTGSWLFQPDSDDFGDLVFATENEACAAQQAYRMARGFDPITGEKKATTP